MAMFPNPPSPMDLIQDRLLKLAALFLFFYSLALTLSPAARVRSWEADYNWGHWLAFGVWLVGIAATHLQTIRKIPERDPYILPIAAILCGWGLLTIWRLTPDFGLRQTVWLLVALLLFNVGLHLPLNLNFIRRYKYLWLTSGILLTGLTFFYGTNLSGTGPRLWLGCCGFYFQPSEPLKLLLIAFLAAYLSDRKFLAASSPTQNLIQLITPTVVMIGLAVSLLLVQRDLGTAFLFLFIYTAIIYLATGKRRFVFISLAFVVFLGVAGYALIDVVGLRIDAWLNPWADPTGSSFQIVQSLIATASGQLFGHGPGLGNPVLVPVSHSDFIFTAITEETGLMGAVAMLILISLLLHRGLRVGLNASNAFQRYLSAGIITYFALQSLLIIGGNIRLLPLTGVTLPFVSYGGSSLLTSFLALLILLRISSERTEIYPVLPSNNSPYTNLGIGLMVGLGAAALVSGLWAIIRSPNLITRTDNPRRAIADQFVPRGNILDRRGTPLTANLGESGNFTRRYYYPPLGSTIGYTHLIFGQAGLESSLDTYLRGLEGLPTLTIWEHQLLYGQHPPGIDVRLSLDLNLQHLADQLVGDSAGAVILLNSNTGEILVISSHPTFDSNTLDVTWPELIQDPLAPLINRATQGAYLSGTVLAPLLLAANSAQGDLPRLPRQLTFSRDGVTLVCAMPPGENTWQATIRAGCPTSSIELGENLGNEQILELYKALGLFSAPRFNLPTASTDTPTAIEEPGLAAIGQLTSSSGSEQPFRVSPLQIALAASTLNNSGIRPAPRLATAIHTSEEGWRPLTLLDTYTEALPRAVAHETATALGIEDMPFWESNAVATSMATTSEQDVSWYLGGTLPTWEGAPLTIVVLLEEIDPERTREIGREILQTAIQP